jgi:hypothetical protein
MVVVKKEEEEAARVLKDQRCQSTTNKVTNADRTVSSVTE